MSILNKRRKNVILPNEMILVRLKFDLPKRHKNSKYINPVPKFKY